MQMRAGGESGRADISDNLSGFDMRAGVNAACKPARMRVAGGCVIGVADAHIVSISPAEPGNRDHAVSNSVNGRAGGCGDIDARVHLRRAENWTQPRAEGGTDARRGV